MHLIILSALQSALLNPIVFVFLGLGRAVAGEQEKLERRQRATKLFTRDPPKGGNGGAKTPSTWNVLLDVLMGFRKNMMVMSVVAGGAYNVLAQRAPLPWWLGIPVEIAGEGFKPLVLVVGGMTLSSSIGHLTSLRLAVLPTILVVLKCARRDARALTATHACAHGRTRAS